MDVLCSNTTGLQVLWGLLLLLLNPWAEQSNVGPEGSRLWENFYGIILFQLVSRPPGVCRILVYCDYAPPAVSCGFFCCLWLERVSLGRSQRVFVSDC